MIQITLPDGSLREYDQPLSVHEVAASIGHGLASAAVAGRVDGNLVDCEYMIEADARVSIVTPQEPDGLEILRRSCALMLAMAVKQLHPQAQMRSGSELGDGFKVAMRDLDIRGAGNLLGAEQSGFVNDLGYELYHKMLDEAVKELKNNEFKDLFANALGLPEKLVADCQIETDFATLIPDDYVKNISERLSLYTRLDNIGTEEELTKFEKEVIDRFGPVPHEVQDLLKMVRLRWEAESLHFEKLTLKSNTMKGYFVTSQNDEFFQSARFGRVIDYIKSHPKQISLKDQKGKLILICEDVKNIDQARKILVEMTQ